MPTEDGVEDSAGCAELPDYGLVLGVLMGVVGSIGINIGQNLQAAGLQKLPELERAKPCKSRMWQVGLAIFIAFSLVNFAALALATANSTLSISNSTRSNAYSGSRLPIPRSRFPILHSRMLIPARDCQFHTLVSLLPAHLPRPA